MERNSLNSITLKITKQSFWGKIYSILIAPGLAPFYVAIGNNISITLNKDHSWTSFIQKMVE